MNDIANELASHDFFRSDRFVTDLIAKTSCSRNGSPVLRAPNP